MSDRAFDSARVDADKVRAILEAAGYEVGKCHPFDAGTQVGVIVWVKSKGPA